VTESESNSRSTVAKTKTEIEIKIRTEIWTGIKLGIGTVTGTMIKFGDELELKAYFRPKE
jgi:hypothetical protein